MKQDLVSKAYKISADIRNLAIDIDNNLDRRDLVDSILILDKEFYKIVYEITKIPGASKIMVEENKDIKERLKVFEKSTLSDEDIIVASWYEYEEYYPNYSVSTIIDEIRKEFNIHTVDVYKILKNAGVEFKEAKACSISKKEVSQKLKEFKEIKKMFK